MSKLRDRQFKSEGSIFPFLKRLFKYSMRYSKWMKGFIAFVLVVAAVEAVTPIVWLNLLDNAIVPLVEQYKPVYATGVKPEVDMMPLLKYSLMILGLGILLASSVFMFINFAGRIQEYVMYDIRQDLFKKLQELSFSFYDKSAVGWLM